MTEKVKLPKQVCVALDEAIKITNDYIILEKIEYRRWVGEAMKILNTQNSDHIMRALVLGYEPELTTEEEIKREYTTQYGFLHLSKFEAYRLGIRNALRIHGIHYDWLEDNSK